MTLRALATLAAVYERDDIGHWWCGACHRTVRDCDADPKEHTERTFRPELSLCIGHQLRKALGWKRPPEA